MCMTNILISLRFPEKLLEEIDLIVKEGHFSNRTEFIKNAVRLELREYRKISEEEEKEVLEISKQLSFENRSVH